MAKKLPLILDPLPDELLSSWVGRMSRAYGRTPFDWCSLLSPHGLCCGRDLDMILDDRLISDLSSRTRIPKEKLFDMQLISYEGCLYPVYDKSIRTLTQFHVSRTRVRLLLYGFQCCPKCLSTDKDPYYRKTWRLAFMVGCPEHRVLLLDCCPICGIPITLSRRQARQNITVCSCGFDLRLYNNQDVLDVSIWHLQNRLLELVKGGKMEIEPGIFLDSCEIFGLLQRLFRICSHQSLLFKKTYTVLDYFHSKSLVLPLSKIGDKNYIEHLNLTERLTVMLIIDYLFKEWPERLIEMVCDCNIAKMLAGDKCEGYIWKLLKNSGCYHSKYL